MNEDPRDNPGVIAPPPLLFAAALVAGFLLHSRFHLRLHTPRLFRFILGGSLISFSFTTVWLAIQAMRRARTNVNPTLPTTAIVEDGPYQFTRNPLYLSLTLFYAGIAVLFNTITVLIPLPPLIVVIRRGVIDREERYLERKFGKHYLDYKARVPRWL